MVKFFPWKVTFRPGPKRRVKLVNKRTEVIIPSTANTTCQGRQHVTVRSTGEELGKKRQEIKWVKN